MKIPAPNAPLDLQYPIGELVIPAVLSSQAREEAIETLAAFPQQLAASIEGLTDLQIDTPYRHDSWTIRQLIHHIADSHTTAYSWMRLALTESWPTVYAYDPAALAELGDSHLPAQVSLQLLDALHRRWTATLQSVADRDWQSRGYIHPETGRCFLDQALAMYSWHGSHHLAHILHCRQRLGWT